MVGQGYFVQYNFVTNVTKDFFLGFVIQSFQNKKRVNQRTLVEFQKKTIWYWNNFHCHLQKDCMTISFCLEKELVSDFF